MFKGILIFIAGFVTGGLVTYKVMETRMIEQIDRENNDLKEYYEAMYNNGVDAMCDDEREEFTEEQIDAYNKAAAGYVILDVKTLNSVEKVEEFKEAHDADEDEEDDDIEGDFYTIEREEYEACMDTYARHDLKYYQGDDTFYDCTMNAVFISKVELPTDQFIFQNRVEYWKNDKIQEMFRIKYVNKSYQKELGFMETPVEKVKKDGVKAKKSV